MPEESATPDLVGLLRRQLDALRRRDSDAVMSFYAPDACQESRALGTSFAGRAAIREVDGKIARVTVYPNIDDARAAAERVVESSG